MPTQNFARLKKTFDDDGFVVVRGYLSPELSPEELGEMHSRQPHRRLMHAVKTFARGTVAALLATGCAVSPSLTVSEFGNESAVVRVEYGLLGPSIEVAEASAGLVARDHCEALGKTNELIASKREPQDGGSGEYVLYYVCEHTDERVPDRRPAGLSDTEGLREVALPMIETSHAEARRHRR